MRLALTPRDSRITRAAWVLTAIAVGLVGWTTFRPAVATPAGGPAMPSSAEIEDRFGVRFLGAYLTAAGGMVQIQYQVIDGDKAVAVHVEGSTPVLIEDGKSYAAPGLAGHGHSKQTPVAGRTASVLLANVGGELTAGDTLTIRVADLELVGVTLE